MGLKDPKMALPGALWAHHLGPFWTHYRLFWVRSDHLRHMVSNPRPQEAEKRTKVGSRICFLMVKYFVFFGPVFDQFRQTRKDLLEPGAKRQA